MRNDERTQIKKQITDKLFYIDNQYQEGLVIETEQTLFTQPMAISTSKLWIMAIFFLNIT